MKTFGSCSIDVQDSKIISVCPRPRRKNIGNSMLPDFHNFRVVLIIVSKITHILRKIESWNLLHVVDILFFYKMKKKFKSIAIFSSRYIPFSLEKMGFFYTYI